MPYDNRSRLKLCKNSLIFSNIGVMYGKAPHLQYVKLLIVLKFEEMIIIGTPYVVQSTTNDFFFFLSSSFINFVSLIDSKWWNESKKMGLMFQINWMDSDER